MELSSSFQMGPDAQIEFLDFFTLEKLDEVIVSLFRNPLKRILTIQAFMKRTKMLNKVIQKAVTDKIALKVRKMIRMKKRKNSSLIFQPLN